VSTPNEDPRALLDRCLETGRLHSAYLLSGSGPEPREAARAFARGIVCTGTAPGPCEECRECVRSREDEEALALDGTGKSGPLLRHVGDHPDLLWVERGESDTRVRIGQVRALQQKLRLRGEGEGRRAGVIADAEWLNAEAQNALLHLLEEPPPRTTLVLVAASPTSLLATVRSRCQRVPFRSPPPDPLSDPERGELVARLETMAGTGVPELLAWAEEYKGARAVVAEEVHTLIETGSAWLRGRVRRRVAEGAPVRGELDADRELAACRRTLDQRNANPQMVAERALLALREAATR
jgi:DNA polymerase III delta prime subunit